jgi:hypothetical protein
MALTGNERVYPYGDAHSSCDLCISSRSDVWLAMSINLMIVKDSWPDAALGLVTVAHVCTPCSNCYQKKNGAKFHPFLQVVLLYIWGHMNRAVLICAGLKAKVFQI